MSEDNNGWPGKSGIPPNPERDGWYWLQESDREIECARWIAKPFLGDSRGRWEITGTEDDWEPYEISNWRYIAPALTPAEVDVRVKQAKRNALEEAVSRVKAYSQNETARNIVTIIYALGEKE